MKPWRYLVSGTVVLLGLAVNLVVSPTAIALTQEALRLLSMPLDGRLLQPDAVPADDSIITSEMISQTELTIPSLWWSRQQFGTKMVEDWFAYPSPDAALRRIDLIISQPVWNASSYVQRYAFVNHFGTAAQDYGFNIRFFNRQQELLAAYICEPTAIADANPPSESSVETAQSDPSDATPADVKAIAKPTVSEPNVSESGSSEPGFSQSLLATKTTEAVSETASPEVTSPEATSPEATATEVAGTPQANEAEASCDVFLSSEGAGALDGGSSNPFSVGP
jgi:hypothetical protein